MLHINTGWIRYIYKDEYINCRFTEETPVGRFHHISTDEVYGTLNETEIMNQNNMTRSLSLLL
jgi:dTDP-D-glucose 4,6-dehydratase